MKTLILDCTIDKIKKYMSCIGEKPFRAGQIFKSLHKGLDFSEMTDLSKTLRTKLQEDFDDQGVRILKTVKSKDETQKFLFALLDGNVIEGVLMKYKYGYTLCVSTQVGCRMNCAFCASGLNGLIRNLSCGEILGEIIAVNRFLGGDLADKRKIINVLLLGSGEPIDNY